VIWCSGCRKVEGVFRYSVSRLPMDRMTGLKCVRVVAES
jgi:hypothetical protein